MFDSADPHRLVIYSRITFQLSLKRKWIELKQKGQYLILLRLFFLYLSLSF